MSPLVLLLLACSPKVTLADPGLLRGEDCSSGACAAGLVCSHDGVCAEEGEVGTGVEGDDCSATAECAYGLVCSGDNTCVSPGAANTGDVGDTCEGDGDCQAGFYCEDGSCVDAGIPWWAGATCPPDDEDGEYFYAYFDIPDLPVSGENDFYSLPFPNDIRLSVDGHVDLSGHPRPGAEAPELGELIDAITAEATGYGLNPTVYFRFNRKQDPTTFRALTADATIQFVSLDEDAADRGPLGALTFRTSTSRGKYICQDWLAVSVYDGHPLLPNHTYAVWLTRGIADQAGEPLTRDDGFKLMMQDERPDDVSNAQAWDTYVKLRDYLAREGVNADDIVAAAVFTTGDPGARVRTFRDNARAAGVTASDLTRCDDGVTSPCDDGGERRCGAASAALVEVHGRLALPGYRGADGDVGYDPYTARPTIVETEQACFALTVPAGDPPAGGWPVAIVQPDAGRPFTATVSDGVAAAFADAGYATLTLELPAHGERGEGADGAYASFFDAAHPRALRGNLLQAMADPHAAEAWLTGLDLPAAESPTGADLRFDLDHLWYVGEGLGASGGMGYLAWSQAAEGGVLGNPEGRLLHVLAGQGSPAPISHRAEAALADSDLDLWNPALNLVQLHLDVADASDHAYGVVRDAALDARHLLVIDGVSDPDVPRDAVRAAIGAADIPTAGAVLDDYAQSTVATPAQDNVGTDDGRRTAASVQLDAGRDALHLAGLDLAVGFCASALDGSPVIDP